MLDLFLSLILGPLSICRFVVGLYGETEVFVSSFIAVRGWVWFGSPKALGHPIPFTPMGAWLGRWDITVSVDISVSCEPSFLWSRLVQPRGQGVGCPTRVISAWRNSDKSTFSYDIRRRVIKEKNSIWAFVKRRKASCNCRSEIAWMKESQSING